MNPILRNIPRVEPTYLTPFKCSEFCLLFLNNQTLHPTNHLENANFSLYLLAQSTTSRIGSQAMNMNLQSLVQVKILGFLILKKARLTKRGLIVRKGAKEMQRIWLVRRQLQPSVTALTKIKNISINLFTRYSLLFVLSDWITVHSFALLSVTRKLLLQVWVLYW